MRNLLLIKLTSDQGDVWVSNTPYFGVSNCLPIIDGEFKFGYGVEDIEDTIIENVIPSNLSLINVNGQIDNFVDEEWLWQKIIVYSGNDTDAFGSLVVRFEGINFGISLADEFNVNFEIAPYTASLNRQIQDDVYPDTVGNTSLINKPLPLCFGRVYGVEANATSDTLTAGTYWDYREVTFDIAADDNDVRAIPEVYSGGKPILDGTSPPDFSPLFSFGYHEDSFQDLSTSRALLKQVILDTDQGNDVIRHFYSGQSGTLPNTTAVVNYSGGAVARLIEIDDTAKQMILIKTAGTIPAISETFTEGAPGNFAGTCSTAAVTHNNKVDVNDILSGDVRFQVEGETDNPAGSVNTPYEVLKPLLERVLTTSQIDLTALTTFSTSMPYELGIHIKDNILLNNALSKIFGGGVLMGMDIGASPKFLIYELKDPAFAAVDHRIDYSSYEHRNKLKLIQKHDPYWRIIVAGEPNHSPITNGFQNKRSRNESTGPILKSIHQAEYRSWGIKESTTIRDDQIAAGALPRQKVYRTHINGLYNGDVQTEAERLFDLFSVKRRLFLLTVSDKLYTYKINECLALTHSRYGFQSEVKTRIIHVIENPMFNETELLLWL